MKGLIVGEKMPFKHVTEIFTRQSLEVKQKLHEVIKDDSEHWET